MRYNRLGRSGLLVSEVSLGAMTFGGGGIWDNIGSLGSSEAGGLVAAALDAGINLIDTANYYSHGRSEEIVGEILQSRGISRNDVLIATKSRLRMGSGVNDVGSSRHHIVNAVEASLRRLRCDHIDLHQLHGFDPLTPIDETLRALDDLVRSGKVSYLGFCNFPAWEAMRAMATSDRLGLARFVAMQAYYNPAMREFEQELQPFCIDQGIGTLVWSPLAGGLLTGKYRAEDGIGRRKGFDFPPVEPDIMDDLWAALDATAESTGGSPAQIVLAWLVGRASVASVILGARTTEQLAGLLAYQRVTLGEPAVAAIDAASAPRATYPAWMVARQIGDRMPGASTGLIPLKKV